MRRISVTELDLYQNCPMSHHLKYNEGLKLKPDFEEPPSSARRTGIAIADSLERGLLLGSRKEALEQAESNDGAVYAIRKVPEWIWNVNRPVAEDKLEVVYHSAQTVQMVGKPDLWYLEQEGDLPLGVHIVEFKSGADTGYRAQKKLERYENWGIQATRYAVLLHDAYDWLADIPFYRQHIFLSTKGNPIEGACIHVSEFHMDNARREMLQLCDTLINRAPERHYGPLCDYCDFAPISRGYLTGPEPSDIIEEMYERGR
jgi:hypothetical protein